MVHIKEKIRELDKEKRIRGLGKEKGVGALLLLLIKEVNRGIIGRGREGGKREFLFSHSSCQPPLSHSPFPG